MQTNHLAHILLGFFLTFTPSTMAQERPSTVSPVAFPSAANQLPAHGKSAVNSFRLQPEDSIQIAVYREPDLSHNTKLDRDGTVVLPLIGEVRIGGLTVKEAREVIERLYEKDYLVNPQVTLTYTSQSAKSQGTFSVLGHVSSPGVFPLPKGKQSITIREALATAGGMTRYASTSKVKVRRQIGKDVKIFEVNLKKMNDDATVESFHVLPGDSINVPERLF